MPSTPQTSPKKRLLIAAGLFVVPVVIVAAALFSLLHKHPKPSSKSGGGSAFNTELPSPNLPAGEKNKLQIYMQAEADSVKESQERSKDNFGEKSAPSESSPIIFPKSGNPLPSRPSMNGVVTSPFQDENDKKVTDRLQQLYSVLGNSGRLETDKKPPVFSPPIPPQDPSPEVARLEKLMQSFQKSDTVANPQLAQVKQVLDEIRDIQHPERAGQFSTLTSPPIKTWPVRTLLSDSSSATAADMAQNGFYGLSDDVDSSVSVSGAIKAVIHESQTVQTGSIVELRLLQDIFVGTTRIPANTFIHGRCSIDGERVNIELSDAIYQGNIYPVKLKVYDGFDGMEGLYVPGAITRDAVKEGMSQGVSGVSLGALDPTLAGQAAAAGIETAKTLLSRKIHIVKVTLNAGHIALLRNTEPLH